MAIIIQPEPKDPGIPSGGGSHENPAYAGQDLRQATNVTIRPTVITGTHVYNLRNQGWAIPRLIFVGDDVTTEDPIKSFNYYAKLNYPSNADSPNPALYQNTQSSHDKTLTRFNAQDLVRNPYSSTQVANGYFIIDALERGISRQANINQLQNQYPNLIYGVGQLPIDTTPGGATCVCEFAGRIFYAGFSGQVNGPDTSSPRMSSYVLFSPTVTDVSSITNCYQVADPTNKDDSTLVDTDGGFVRIEGAYGIVALANIGSNVAIIAANGVWLLAGGNNYGFSATNYKVTKITNSGCTSPGSVVVVENALFYWGADGIYNVAPNAYGDYVATNITIQTIQTYYSNIDPVDIIKCEGIYDSYEKRVRWIYGQRSSTNNDNLELVFDLILKAFYPSKIEKISNGRFPMVAKGVLTNPFVLNTTANDVVLTTGDPVVLSTGDPVVVSPTEAVVTDQVREVKYLVITQGSPTISYSFGTYNEPYHYDWVRVDGTGIDASSYLVTGTLSGGNFQMLKDVPYVTFYLRKTEDGFQDDGFGDYTPTNQSSCLVSPQWAWANSATSGKWSRQFQAYRFNRQYYPADISDPFNNGFSVVSSRTKIRGSGNVLSLRIDSEAGKHMELLGWSMIVNSNNDV